MSLNYNPLAGAYAVNRKVNPKVFEELVDVGKIQPASTVLEVGCGTGNYISAIQHAIGCTGFGCDPSDEMLARAVSQSSAVYWNSGRGERLDYADATFDLVFSVDVIHHMIHAEEYFREAYRVLRPTGLVCTVTESEQAIRARRPFSKYFPDTVCVDLARYPSIESLKTMMSNAGFRSIRAKTIHQECARTDIEDFRAKAYSCLHLIPEKAFKDGIEHMDDDLRLGPIPFISNYLMLWGSKTG